MQQTGCFQTASLQMATHIDEAVLHKVVKTFKKEEVGRFHSVSDIVQRRKYLFTHRTAK